MNQCLPRNYCFYFPRITVDEEFCHFGPSTEAVERALTEGSQYSEIDEVIQAYRHILGVNLSDVIKTYVKPTDDVGNRIYQVGLYVIVAHFLKCRFGMTPSALAFYSSGVQAAYLFAGVFTIEEFLQDIVSINNHNRSLYLRTGRELPLGEVLIESTAGDDVEGFIRTQVRVHRLEDRVFFKDLRGRYASLIAGYRADVETINMMARKQFARAKPRDVRTADAAHIPLYSRRELRRSFGKYVYRPPRYTLIGISGEVIPAKEDAAAALMRMYEAAGADPMQTGKTMRTAADYGRRLIVVGTPFGARVLNHIDLGAMEGPYLVADIFDALLDR